MGGGELGEDYLTTSDYNVLILSDGIKKCLKKKKKQRIFFAYIDFHLAYK